MKYPLVFLFCLAWLSTASAFNPEHFNNSIFDDYIKTVLINKTGVAQAYPFIELNGGEQLILEFDDLSGTQRDFQYTILYCDYDWKPSNVFRMDYFQGMDTDYINEYRNSFSTYKEYTNYKLAFPNENMRLLLPGNYILKVFTDSPDRPVITRRFYVFESQVTVAGEVRAASNPRLSRTSQEIKLQINLRDLSIPNPYNDIKVVIMQNGRWDNAQMNFPPTFLRDNTLIYDQMDGIVFEGGNEFRAVDLRNLRIRGEKVESITHDSVYHMVLVPEESRARHAYSTRIDINGRRVIEARGLQNPSVDAEYIKTTFRFMNTTEERAENIYLFGELTDWKINENFKLHYDHESGLYTNEFYLKQGYYNYKYVTAGKNGRAIHAPFEGNYFQTENDYTIFVYFRPMNMDADLLIGLQRLNTNVR